MNFSNYIKNLERRGIISRKPHPVVPFILAFISLVLGIIVLYMNVDKIWSYAFFFLAGFSFVFAILHLIVVRIVERKG
jgi:hypothetical protein|tara:strand:- start:939 stop:1172 length:234 start_codon:yes stop_codon:yes gene_type:complete